MSHHSIPESLSRQLEAHGRTYAPHYPPVDNSDHGPMACLAMYGLGFEDDAIAAFAETYRTRLVAPAPALREPVSRVDWERHIGRRDSYRSLIAFFEGEIRTHGWVETVRRYLPVLISGWVKDAFHPVIRLAYGIEFEVRSEIAAGLAYLTITGNDARLIACAERTPTHAHGRRYLFDVGANRDRAFSRGPFNERYERILNGAFVAPAGTSGHDPMSSVSRACAEVFDATHDFFALHLVTSSHAFRVCAPYAGAGLSELYTVGIAIGYLAIGAPPFDALESVEECAPIPRLERATDEHDLKLAYSCAAQGQAYADPIYQWVATRYLAPRLRAE